MHFETLGLMPALLQAVREQGYQTPTPIQEKVIPVVLEGRDVLASAQTGTGKTAGFALPVLQLLAQGANLRNRPVRVLVLTPTRELAAQVGGDFNAYSAFMDIKTSVIFGGVSQVPQVAALRKGVDVLIATPGRLLDLHGQGELSLSNVNILILDEADRMLDMGFLRDIKKILPLLPPKRQNLLFSATFSKEIKQLAGSFLNNPATVEATPENTTAEKVMQRAYRVDKRNKASLLKKLISEGEWEQVLVFTRTKHGANRLCEKLERYGITAAAIHGNKSQSARTKALDDFKRNEIRVLVATDIAARGLDIPLLPYVINYELPNVPEDYVHRIGRTGRAGASGDAISLVSPDEGGYLKGIEKLLGIKMEIEDIKGADVALDRDNSPNDDDDEPEERPFVERRPKTQQERPARQDRGHSQRPQSENTPKSGNGGGFGKKKSRGAGAQNGGNFPGKKEGFSGGKTQTQDGGGQHKKGGKSSSWGKKKSDKRFR